MPPPERCTYLFDKLALVIYKLFLPAYHGDNKFMILLQRSVCHPLGGEIMEVMAQSSLTQKLKQVLQV